MNDVPRKREGQQLLIRFAEGSDLRERLREIAENSGRTLTAEILFRLERSLEEEQSSGAAASDEIENLRVGLRAEAVERQMLESRLHHLELRLRAVEARI